LNCINEENWSNKNIEHNEDSQKQKIEVISEGEENKEDDQ